MDSILYYNMRFIEFKNTEGTEAPEWAAMELTGIEKRGKRVIATVKQPDSNNLSPERVIFNLGCPVPASGYGMATWSFPTWATPKTGTPTQFQTAGTESGTWTLTLDNTGFVVVGSEGGNIRIHPKFGGGGATLWRATLNENMGATTTNQADADLLEMGGTDTTDDVDVKDPLGIFSDLENTNACLVLEQDGEYFVIQAPCPT